MRKPYTYQIEVNRGKGQWRVVTRTMNLFSRDPRSTARAILERWIIAHPDQVTGGERIMVHGPGAHAHAHDDGPSVRVSVYPGDYPGDRSSGPNVPVAVAYLGHDERDYRWAPRSASAPNGLVRVGRLFGRRLRGRLSEAA